MDISFYIFIYSYLIYVIKFIVEYTNDTAVMITQSGSKTKASQIAITSRTSTNGGPASLFISTNGRLTTRMLTTQHNTVLN